MLDYPKKMLARNLSFFKSFETNTDTQIFDATIEYLSKLPKYSMNHVSSILYTVKGYQRNVLFNAISALIF